MRGEGRVWKPYISRRRRNVSRICKIFYSSLYKKWHSPRKLEEHHSTKSLFNQQLHHPTSDTRIPPIVSIIAPQDRVTICANGRSSILWALLSTATLPDPPIFVVHIPWRYFQCIAIFRILFGHFLRKEFTTGDFHPCQ